MPSNSAACVRLPLLKEMARFMASRSKVCRFSESTLSMLPAARGEAEVTRIYIQKMLCQQDDVLAALSQGRKMKLNRVETIEEVLTKLTLTDFFTQVGIGGSKYAHIHVVQHV